MNNGHDPNHISLAQAASLRAADDCRRQYASAPMEQP
jgi:hypothetical protein